MNRVIVMGNLTRDPEYKNVGSTNLCNFGIAINRKTKTGNETTFIDLEAWGKTAENIAKYFTKGKPILIEGRLKLDEWVDTTSGQKRSKLKVVAERFHFCGGNAQQTQSPQQAPTQATAPQRPTSDGGGLTQAPAAPTSPFI